MNKVYARINWQNEPSVATPINDVNLNKIDYALNEVDNRIITLDTTKATESDALLLLKDVTYNATTGVFTFTKKNGTQIVADLNIEKIPVSFSMSADGVITMTTTDGATYTADVGSLIEYYSFNDSSRIDFTTTTDADGNKTITADIIEGSITSRELQTNYLADITTQANNASASATASSTSATTSANKAKLSESWAVGNTNTREGEDTNNAKYWSEQAQAIANLEWNAVQNKPFSTIGSHLSVDASGALNAEAGGGDASQVTYHTTNTVEGALDSLNSTIANNEDNGYLVKNHYKMTKSGTDTINGISVTYNADGTVKLNGTANANSWIFCDTERRKLSDYFSVGSYYLSGTNADQEGRLQLCIYESASGSQTRYLDLYKQNQLTVTFTSEEIATHYFRVLVFAYNGNAFDNNIFSPMIRSTSIADSTYTPFSMSNVDLTKQREKDIKQYVEGVNLLNPTLKGTTTNNGITCVESNGTYTLNGTASSVVTFALANNVFVKNGYKLIGCPSGGSDSTYQLMGYDSTNTFRDLGNGTSITLDTTLSTVQIVIRAGVVCNNMVFKPMLTEDASLGYDDFVQYCGYSNRTLSNEIATLVKTKRLLSRYGSEIPLEQNAFTVITLDNPINSNLSTFYITLQYSSSVGVVTVAHRYGANGDGVCWFAKSLGIDVQVYYTASQGSTSLSIKVWDSGVSVVSIDEAYI